MHVAYATVAEWLSGKLIEVVLAVKLAPIDRKVKYEICCIQPSTYKNHLKNLDHTSTHNNEYVKQAITASPAQSFPASSFFLGYFMAAR